MVYVIHCIHSHSTNWSSFYIFIPPIIVGYTFIGLRQQFPIQPSHNIATLTYLTAIRQIYQWCSKENNIEDHLDQIIFQNMLQAARW